MTLVTKTALLALFSILLLAYSTNTVVRPFSVLAKTNESVDAYTLVRISGVSSYEKDGGRLTMISSSTVSNDEVKKTGWSDIEYLTDSNNNTMVDYKNLFGLHIGKVYNPNFIDNADWFLESSNFEDHGGYFLIPYNYNWHFYSKISQPWYGCEAQSKAMLVTAKKYNETGDSKYLQFSRKVFDGLKSPVLNHGGWLMGVVADENNAKILNSQLFCVANLMTYYQYTGDERAIKLFGQGVNVLEKNIGDLTKDCGTYYSLSKDNLVSYQKHPEYIKMLERLNLMAKSHILKKELDKWRHNYLFPCYS